MPSSAASACGRASRRAAAGQRRSRAPGASRAPEPTTRPREYIEPLRSFRGLGVLMVAYYHCQAVLGGELPMRAAPERGVGAAQVAAHYLSFALLNGHGARLVAGLTPRERAGIAAGRTLTRPLRGALSVSAGRR